MPATPARPRATIAIAALALLAALTAALLVAADRSPTRALGPGNAGICEYSDTMRKALLAHLDKEFFECDESAFKGTSANDPAWIGDLNVTPYVGAKFVPGKGELDGYAPGSRVDLRGSGLGIADLDVNAALGSHGTSNQRSFGADSDLETRGRDRFVGLTFLLDGGVAANTGFSGTPFSAVEGEIAWIGFQWSAIPFELSNWDDTITGTADAGDDGYYLVIELKVDLEGGSEEVYFLVNSKDSVRTLYAVPFLVPDDTEIERSERIGLELKAIAVSDSIPSAVNFDATPTYRDKAKDYFEEIERAISRGDDDERVQFDDDDSPAIEVCDRSRPVRDWLVRELNESCSEISNHDLAGITSVDLDDSDIDELKRGDFSGLTKLRELDLTDNDLRSLPAGVFDGAGSERVAPAMALIDVSGNPGPRGAGFDLGNASASFRASVGPRQAVRLNTHALDDDPDYGLERSSYSAAEGGTLVLGVTGLEDSAVLFRSLGSDTGTYEDRAAGCPAPCDAPPAAQIEKEGRLPAGICRTPGFQRPRRHVHHPLRREHHRAEPHLHPRHRPAHRHRGRPAGGRPVDFRMGPGHQHCPQHDLDQSGPGPQHFRPAGPGRRPDPGRRFPRLLQPDRRPQALGLCHLGGRGT